MELLGQGMNYRTIREMSWVVPGSTEHSDIWLLEGSQCPTSSANLALPEHGLIPIDSLAPSQGATTLTRIVNICGLRYHGGNGLTRRFVGVDSGQRMWRRSRSASEADKDNKVGG